METNCYFTSDNHFGHKGILKHCLGTREGADIVEHDEIMIQRWNSVVKPTSQVYCLGDLSFYTKPETNQAIFSRLNGEIHLIKGNHDYWAADRELHRFFTSIQDYKRIRIDGIKIDLFHYPIEEWRDCHKGSYHLFGHVHGALGQQQYRRMDVGIDTRPGMTPYSWAEVHAILKERPQFPHHGRVQE